MLFGAWGFCFSGARIGKVLPFDTRKWALIGAGWHGLAPT
jgi:hypothetical protein